MSGVMSRASKSVSPAGMLSSKTSHRSPRRNSMTVHLPSVFTVTTSLKGPVPSLFWARMLNWYVVSGSKPGTTIQSWPPGTGLESQSCGPKRSLFSLGGMRAGFQKNYLRNVTETDAAASCSARVTHGCLLSV
ncbi:hypothetical protein EYF80_013088 [Liparis tanakae]|uniref:Uncharacterized protein n=1 Tax=Liparis tanakae TaxID=230148 RepID=A0A4Z2IFA2_9TELE|nr:hypothetical protein EYF80_013088 [Liparis tanakae]